MCRGPCAKGTLECSVQSSIPSFEANGRGVLDRMRGLRVITC